MDLESGLTALFQAPFDDTQNVSASQLASGYAATFDALAGYAADVDAIDPTTYDLALRQIAADLLVTSCLCACFAALCEGLAAKAHIKVYATDEEIGVDLRIVEDAWGVLALRSFDADLRAQLVEVMTRTTDVLHQLEANLPNITSVDAPEMPVSVLSYWLYDTDSKEDTILGLNPEHGPWYCSGATTVLSY